ncbi:hypothetical protein Q3G72_012878 [Acer saccharum]|nr:hypothetical protein Q3G72_012878 [Acer saccharum]
MNEEITKVIEIGVSLRVDFNGKIMEMEEVISKCEKEEKERLESSRKREEKKEMVRKLVFRHKPMDLFIQESKLKVFDNTVICKLGGTWLTRGVGVDFEGAGRAASGLISLWKEDSFVVKACISCKICIILAGEMVLLNKEIMLCKRCIILAREIALEWFL